MSSNQTHQGNLPSLNDIISETKEVEPNTLIISEEKPQEIIYSGNISSQRGNVNQSSTINGTQGPSSIKIIRKIVTSQPVTETHVTKTKVITTTTRGGMPATTKITNYNNIASNNISSVNKTKTTTTPTTTNNYTRPKITSTVTYNKVGTNNVNPNINNKGPVYNKNQVGNYKNPQSRVQNSHSSQPQKKVISTTKYNPRPVSSSDANIRRITIVRGEPIENIEITHIIYSIRPIEFHIREKLDLSNLSTPCIQITEEERNNLQKTGKVEARFSSNCDNMKPEPVNLKGKLTHYQHAQSIGMTDDKNPYINPKYYFSEIKNLNPIIFDKGEINTQSLTFRSDGKNISTTRTISQPKTQTKPVSTYSTTRTVNNYSQGRSNTNYNQSKINSGNSNRGVISTSKTTTSSNYRGNSGTGNNGQIVKETTTKVQMGSRSQFNNQNKPITTTSTERRIYNQNNVYKK